MVPTSRPLLLTALLVLAALSPAGAQPAEGIECTHFVDAAKGSDAAPGTRQRPWQSLVRVNRAGLAPGDTVCFRRGQVFRGTLVPPASGAPGAPLTFAAYGQGPPPILSASRLLDDPAAWNRDEGTGLYYAQGVSHDPVVVSIDGRAARRKTSPAELAGPDDFFYDPHRRRLYIFAADNPARQSRVEISSGEFVVGLTSADHLAFSGLHLSHAARVTFAGWDADHIAFSDCAFTLSGDTHLQFHHGSGPGSVTGCRFDDWNLQRRAGYAVQAIDGSGPVTVERCVFTATAPGGGRDHTAVMNDERGWIRRVAGSRFLGNRGNLADDGVVIWHPASRADVIEIMDNEFVELGGVAILLQELSANGAAPEVLVSGNRIREAAWRDDLDKEALRIRHSGRARVVVWDNMVNGTRKGQAAHHGITVDNAAGAVVANNTVTGADHGIYVSGGSSRVTVTGNVLRGNRGPALKVDRGSSAEVERNVLR